MRESIIDRILVITIFTSLMASFLIVTREEEKSRIQETEMVALKDTVLYLIEIQEMKNAN